jgi:hypothetical protein
MRDGNASASTYGQDLSLQKDALDDAGCERDYEEQIAESTKGWPKHQKIVE